MNYIVFSFNSYRYNSYSNNMFLWSCLFIVLINLVTGREEGFDEYVQKPSTNSEFSGNTSEKLDSSRWYFGQVEDNAFKNVSNMKIWNIPSNGLSSLSEDTFNNLTVINVATKTLMIPNGVDDVDRFSHDILHGKTALVEICLNGNELISVEHKNNSEKHSSNCQTYEYDTIGTLNLRQLSIAEFQKSWYKLEDPLIHDIDLSGNLITRLTSEMFNDLPVSITSVNLAFNQIKRLEKGVIVNKHLRTMFFDATNISEIEDNAFINTNLTNLSLMKNLLNDTRFAATLPLTLTGINLIENFITKISPESFSKLKKLEVLRLQSNSFTKINSDSLRGLTGLKVLDLMNNDFKIEAGSFEELTALEILYMDVKDINKLELNVFADLKNIKTIFLHSTVSWNLEKSSLVNLPNNLEVIDLRNNTLKHPRFDIFTDFGKNMYLIFKKGDSVIYI